MKVNFLLQFEYSSANGILLKSLVSEFYKINPDVHLYYQPFKYSQNIDEHDERLDIVSAQSPWWKNFEIPFFRSKGALRLIQFISFILFYFPLTIIQLSRCDHLVIQKPIGLGPIYLWFYKIVPFSPKVHIIFDDWEGAGGMASFRSSGQALKIAVATWMEEFSAQKADSLICRSKILVKRFEAFRLPSEICYIPNGSGMTPINELQPPSITPFKIIHVGSYKQVSLVNFLVDLAQLIKDSSLWVEFHIVGSGPLSDDIQKISHSDKIIYHGQIPFEDIPRLIDDSHLCLLYLNPNWPDTLLDQARSSTKMFEYMSRGKVILGPSFGEPLHIIQDGVNGLVSEPNAMAYFEKIKRLLLNDAESPASIAKMSGHSLEEFKRHYHHSILAMETLEWLENQ